MRCMRRACSGLELAQRRAALVGDAERQPPAPAGRQPRWRLGDEAQARVGRRRRPGGRAVVPGGRTSRRRSGVVRGFGGLGGGVERAPGERGEREDRDEQRAEGRDARARVHETSV